jgi:hypothetical protein
MVRRAAIAMSLLLLGLGCRTPQAPGGAPARVGAAQDLSECMIDGEPANEYYQCDVDFDHFLYTSGQTTHVFSQTATNPCVWVSSTVPTFHLTSTPIGAGQLHVTFQNTGDRCPVNINTDDQCSSAPDSRCSTAEKDIAINACIGFAVACSGR